MTTLLEEGSMRRRWLAIAVILTVPSGCDNVTWGGVDVHLQSPPTQSVGAAVSDTTDTTNVGTAQAQPLTPALLAGTRDGASATLTVVGSLRGDGLRAFAHDDSASSDSLYLSEHHLMRGSAVTLFAEGVRVGRLTIQKTGVDSAYCVPRPTVTGIVEMVPSAAGAQRLFALPAADAASRPYGDYESFRDRYDQRVASLQLAMDAIPKVGAKWPPSLLDTRADIQVFQLPGTSGLSVAATFLYHDELSTAPPEAGAYALFVMGTERGGEYQSDFVWYRNVADEGKGAPRYFGHLDLNGDGQDEILLDVLGSGRRWYAVLGRRNGTWVRTFQDPCGGSGERSGN